MAPGDGVIFRAIFQDQKSIEGNAVLLYNAGNGVIVQLGERLHGMQEVVSSSLISSIFLFPKFKSADSQQILNSFASYVIIVLLCMDCLLCIRTIMPFSNS